MKLLLGLVIWTAQLVYLIATAVFKTIGQLFGNLSSATQGHLKENERRGKTFVKAYYFLEALEFEALEGGTTDSVETANDISASLFESWSDPDADNQTIRRAMAYAKQHHDGNQIPVIEAARARGFNG